MGAFGWSGVRSQVGGLGLQPAIANAAAIPNRRPDAKTERDADMATPLNVGNGRADSLIRERRVETAAQRAAWTADGWKSLAAKRASSSPSSDAKSGEVKLHPARGCGMTEIAQIGRSTMLRKQSLHTGQAWRRIEGREFDSSEQPIKPARFPVELAAHFFAPF
jgi:hypothetical protein